MPEPKAPSTVTRLAVNITREQHRQTKVLAAESDVTVTAIVTVLLQQVLDDPVLRERTIEAARALE